MADTKYSTSPAPATVRELNQPQSTFQESKRALLKTHMEASRPLKVAHAELMRNQKRKKG